jgi:hypothetical protein
VQIRRRKGIVLPKKSVLAITLLVIFLTLTFSACKVSAASTKIAVNPPTTVTTLGSSFSVDVNVTDIVNFTCWQFNLYYLKSILNCTAVTEGPFLKTGGSTYFNPNPIVNNYNSTHGCIQAYSTLLGSTSVSGSGVIVTVVFKAVGLGNSPLHLDEIKLGDEKIPPQPIPYTAADGTVQVVPAVGHDVAITDVIPIKSVVGKGYGCNITVVTENHGSYGETFNVTVYANTTVIASQAVTLTSGNSTTISLVWDTTGFTKGSYTISAYAWPVPGETDTADNTCMGGIVTVTIPGDLNGDFKVSLADLVTLAIAYGSRPGDTRWNPNADIDGNSVVGLSDLVILANHYGQPLP